MKKVILAATLALLLFLYKPTSVSAAEACSSNNITISMSPTSANTGSGPIDVTITVVVDGSTPIDLTRDYQVTFRSLVDVDRYSELKTVTAGTNIFTITIPNYTDATYNVKLENTDGIINTVFCIDGKYISSKKVPANHCSNGALDPGNGETGTCFDPIGDPGCCDCGGSECRPCTTCPAASPPAAGVGATAPPPCHTEFDAAGSTTGVNTGLGCIPAQPQDLVKWVLKYAILMGGGIAFLLSIGGGLTILLAGGNPEKINSGKEIIGSAIAGLAFIIFSVFLLRFIGFDILQLPGFKNP